LPDYTNSEYPFMEPYCKTYEVRWSDMDPNRHLRHSVYNDYAAHTRVSMFGDYGLSISEIAKEGLGPILFREETRFYKEIQLSEIITVKCAIQKIRKDGSRWSFIHNIYKEDNSLAAEITVEGAWLDLKLRKLGQPTEEMMKVINAFPKSEDFRWQD